MIRISCNRNIHTFMYNKFPQLVRACLYSRVNNFKKDRFDYLNKLLKEDFGLNIYQLIKLFTDNLKVNNHNDKDYYVSVGDVIVNKVNLEAIVKTVDYGNSKFPPFKLFNSSLIFVNNNLEALYKYSYLGVN